MSVTIGVAFYIRVMFCWIKLIKMELEEIIKRNYEYAKECIEESIEYITSGDCIYGADPKKESENTKVFLGLKFIQLLSN